LVRPGVLANVTFNKLWQVLGAEHGRFAPSPAPILAPRKTFSGIGPIHRHRQANLFHVAEAGGLLGLDFGLGQRRQEQPGQNRDDRDDHEQLDQSKSAPHR
jgi:hypothetical protein